MRNKQLYISSKLSINLNNNICNAGFVKGYQTMSKSSKRSSTDMSDHKSIKPRLNDICELVGVDLGYRLEKITIHVYQGANEAGHQWNSFHRATSTLDIDKVVIVYCNIKMVKDNRWNPQDLIDWLLLYK